VDGELVLLDRAGGWVHQLNGTASFVWSRLDGSSSTEWIARQVVDAFEVDPATASRDVAAIVDQFRALGLLAEGPDPGRT
jgi:hypothetical protein